MSYHGLKDIPQTERDLEYLFEKKIYFKNELEKMQRTGLSSQLEADNRDFLIQQIMGFGAKCRAELKIWLRFRIGRSATPICYRISGRPAATRNPSSS